MDLLEYLISILGDEEGKSTYYKISKDKKFDLLVQDKKNPAYVDKKTYDELEIDNTELAKQNKKHENDLKNLKEAIKDNEELQNTITTLQEENRTQKETYEKEKAEIKYNYALTGAIEKSGAKNAKAIKAMLDLEKVKYVDGTLIGLDEQIEALKKSDDYMFNLEKPNGTGRIDGERIGDLDGKGSNTDVEGNSFIKSILSNTKSEKATNEVLDGFFK